MALAKLKAGYMKNNHDNQSLNMEKTSKKLNVPLWVSESALSDGHTLIIEKLSFWKRFIVFLVADFGLHELRETAEHLSNDTLEVYKKLWCAPELLRDKGPARGTQKGDIYSFGIILYEIYGRSGPYGEEQTTASEIIKMVTYPDGQLKRPDIELLRTIAADMDTGKWFLSNTHILVAKLL